ncbi:MAG: CotH kinase family protein [Chitinophagaceae bacterium]|nr:CotH kinase family protein [Chitinophagaceae bacterium]
MKKYFNSILLTGCFLFLGMSAHSQALYDLNTIQKIEIQFSQANWDYQMDTAKHGSEGYLMADWVKVNGVLYDSVGVKYKGNSSYDSTQMKNPLHIAFDEFKDQSHQGYKDIKLSNGYGDPSVIREVLGYRILKNYMHCPESNFAQVYINGNLIGLYSSAENIDKKFCGDHFYSNYNPFFKCNPISNPSPANKSNLKYINADSNSYMNLYEMKSKTGWNDFVKLCDTVTNYTASLGNNLDMDRVAWMLAFNNVLVNLDSYSGVFCQNYYVYKDNTAHYNPIIWDLNMAFGAFPFSGAGGTSMGNQTVTSMQQFPPTNHSTDTYWPLINDVFANDRFRKTYIAHMRTIISDMFASGIYNGWATQLQSIVDTAVQSDPNKFFTYTQFQNGMNTNTTVGSYTVPGINTLMDARATYLQSTPEFALVPPSINNINTGAAPAINTNVNITAAVSNATTVYLGYRFDKTIKFAFLPMYDDGAHNDGASGDGVYGASLNMSYGQLQYYFYAENADAVMLSPQQAEHVFYTLYATTQEPSAGQIVINELLADNANNAKDEYNDEEDWIELYNNSNQLLNLSNLYLSDDQNNLQKWIFPSGSTINPNAYTTIWADDDSLQQILHTNFSLSKDTGHLYLSNASGTILDSISFTAQIADVSYGRYPNGTGSFTMMNTTFGYQNNNDPLSIPSVLALDQVSVFPNPAHDQLTVQCNGKKLLKVTNMYGQQMVTQWIKDQQMISTLNWSPGLYFVQCGKTVTKVAVSH